MADYKEMADKEVARLAGRFPPASASEAPTLMADLPGGGVPPAAIPAAAPATAPVETLTKPRTVVPSAGVLPSALGEMTPDFGRFKKAIDVVPSLLEAGQKLSRAQADETQAKMEGQALLAKEQASALESHAQTVRNDIAAQERKLAEFPYPEFHPTRENAQSLGELFSIVSTMGVLLGGAGKLSSINALNAMGGMLKGWQAGRADLFKREKETFDKEFQRIKSIHEDLKRTFDEYMKARAVDKEAAMYKAQELATKAGANSIIAAQIKVGDYKAVADSLQAFANMKQHTEDMEARAAQHRETLAAQERLRLATLTQKQEIRDEKAMQAVGPALRSIAENYPEGTLKTLVGASPDDKKRVQGAYRAIEESESAADFVARNPRAVGALAKAKNFINLDAIKSLQSSDAESVAGAKAALIDGQLDAAAAKGLISKDDVEAAKILQKKLFGLALSDVQGSGQRGSVYLDRQFQNLYDQASRVDTLTKIIRERAEENNRNLRVYRLNVERHNNPEQFPLMMSDTQEELNKYMKERGPAKGAVPEDIKKALSGKTPGYRAKKGNKTYIVKTDGTVEEE